MSEALRLAALVDHGSDNTQIEREVAAELRRLHALNAELEDALWRILESFEPEACAVNPALVHAAKTLAKWEASK